MVGALPPLLSAAHHPAALKQLEILRGTFDHLILFPKTIHLSANFGQVLSLFWRESEIPPGLVRTSTAFETHTISFSSSLDADHEPHSPATRILAPSPQFPILFTTVTFGHLNQSIALFISE
jgi:hypothetical protein